MKKIRRQISFALAVMLPLPIAAYPDGAPWGSAYPGNPPNNCAGCHYDIEAVLDSFDVSLSVSPSRAKTIKPGTTVTFNLQFRNPENKKIGFQIMADVGTFSTGHTDVEFNGRLARSIVPRNNESWAKVNGSGFVVNATAWHLQWVAPENIDQGVKFWIAVNESNDDQSALGDRVHYKMVKFRSEHGSMLLPALR